MKSKVHFDQCLKFSIYNLIFILQFNPYFFYNLILSLHTVYCIDFKMLNSTDHRTLFICKLNLDIQM